MGATIKSRPDLVSRLMRERQVARFLVAPPGYGKTFLALEYAQVIFGFHQVAWIDARSPCFLRDLDKGSLSADMLKRDAEMRLVVFDDVPRLGSERADLLSQVVDELLDAGCEVMVLCHPSSDAFSGRQIDRICLNARDLMLDASEIDDEREAVLTDDDLRAGSSIARAIPALAWGQKDAASAFTRGIAREELPDEVASIHYLLLALGDATISRLCSRFGLAPTQVEALERDYPHLGISAEDDLVSSVILDPDHLARAYGTKLERIARSLSFEFADGMGTALADALLDGGNAARACAVAAAMMGKAARIQWMTSMSRRLSRMLCVFPAWRFGTTLGPIRADTAGSFLDVQQAWRLSYLGDARSALLVASKVASRSNASMDDRISALVMVALFGNNTLRAGALERLSMLVSNAKDAIEDALSLDVAPETAVALCLVARFEAERSQGSELAAVAPRLARVWSEVAQACSDGDAMALAGALLLDICPELGKDREFCRLVEGNGASLPVGIFRLEAYRVLGDLAKRGERASAVATMLLSEGVLEQSRSAERELAAQQQEYGAFVRALEKRRANRTPYARPDDESSTPDGYEPHVHVSLFGGIEVILDGRRLDAGEFTQTKMRALLALLTMANGREVSRDRLVESLWPASSERTAQKNLYTNWAALKRTLSLPDGSCPFLHHVQGSYRIDGRLVTSDVQQVSAVCRALALEKPDPDRFRSLLDDLNRLYRGDLLPSETKCDAIIEARDEFRSQVSDALVQATFRLLDMGEDQMALWFARSALEHERRQEDPYFALMSAQIACGQREAALETYRVCCRALMRAFRIDPSHRMINLYRQIVESEEEF